MYSSGGVWSLNYFILLYFSMVKQFWTFFGINTNLFQCAAELKTKTSILLPWDFRLRLDIDERKYSLEFPVPIIPYDIFKLRYVWFCFSFFCFIGVSLSILVPTETSRTNLKLTSTVARTVKSIAHIAFLECILNCNNQKYIIFIE